MTAIATGLILSVGVWLFSSQVFVPARLIACAVFGVTAALLCLGGIHFLRRTRSANGGVTSSLVHALVFLSVLAAGQWLFHLCYWRFVPYVHASVGPGLLSAVLRIFGAEATDGGDCIVVQTLAQSVVIRPSLERIGFYPLGLAFVGAVVCMCFLLSRRRIMMSGLLAVVWLGYSALRFVVLVLISIDFDSPSVFWNPAVTVVSLLPLIPLIAAVFSWTEVPHRFSGGGVESPESRRLSSRWRVIASTSLAGLALAGAVFADAFEWPGTRKQGRVLLDDYHSGHWERSTGTFGEDSLGQDEIYNYACLRDWLSQFYNVTVNTTDRITPEQLQSVDVLVLKTPVQPFLESERDAVVEWVRRGGGLWLVGDHTNLYGMSTFLNPMGEPFGLRFRFDDTFDLVTGRPSHYAPPLLGTHPVLASVKAMDFQTSATIEAPWAARPVIVGYRLGSEYVDYGHVNFFGNIKVDPQDDFGLFLQAAAVSFGDGRVLAFSDSTVFSNFSQYLPGIAELAAGSVEYLNRTDGDRTLLEYVLWAAPALLLVGILVTPWSHRWGPAFPLWGCVAGVFVGGWFSGALNRNAYAMTAAESAGQRVVVDNSISSYRLPSSLEYQVTDTERCFDAFYLNLVRVGLRPVVGDALGSDAEPGNIRVFIHPTKPPEPAEIDELRRFVAGGGRLMILESSEYLAPATRSMLEAFDMSLEPGVPSRDPRVRGAIRMDIPPERRPRDLGNVAVFENRFEQGRIVLVIGAERFSRKYMGQVYKNPDTLEREWHRLQYFITHRLVEP